MRAVQLSLTPDRGLDPAELAELTSPERGRLYAELELDDLQITAIETAVRMVLSREYPRAGR